MSTPLVLVVVLCTALPWSQFKDHCDEIRTPIVVEALPNACVAKAQEEIARNPDRYSPGDIASIGCERRDRRSVKASDVP